MKRSSTLKSITILALALIPFMFLVVFHNDPRHLFQAINLPQLHSSGGRDGAGDRLSRFFHPVLLAPRTAADPDLRLLLGVITRPDYHLRRHLVRHVYALQQPSLEHTGARVDVRFVFCNLTSEEHRVLVALEIKLYDDIIILNCTENMNNGKTYTYFSSLPGLLDGGGRQYDFVIKADDDAFFKLDNLVAEVRKWPSREDVYAGSYVPCASYTSETYRFFAGYGYMLSWDLVEWIATSEIPKNRSVGLEDKLVGMWLRQGKRGENKFDMNPKMYDYLYERGTVECFRHEFVAETVAVHQLKDDWKWVKTIEFFNLTKGLKPSKLYSLAYP